ncbi:MAG: cytochrome c3 family protein [Candidatus Loosdrechtia sp.]|uniref:cytochrome c3 family protein n=1 Tax=Candidatus Loosdrechtia sp. TaxID=3101272 RepID=UPI003A74E7AF|nr:MAG: multiheme c-type cytochrome [Candidatus Jettenia sp. AMX2]
MFDQKYQPSTSSCTDRCHVNYLAYRTIYQGKVFRHKTHSLNHGLACNQCHDSSPVNMEMHGRLVIQNKDCWTCHHRKTDKIPINPLSLKNNASSGENSDKPLVKSISANEDGCLKCHADVRAYINGNIKNSISKKPDWMFNAVSCTDCHKLEPEGYSFKAVRENCVECHNPDYGLLYDAWKETLSSKTKQFYKKDINKDIHDILRLVQLYGMHNFRLSQMLLESIEQ